MSAEEGQQPPFYFLAAHPVLNALVAAAKSGDGDEEAKAHEGALLFVMAM